MENNKKKLALGAAGCGVIAVIGAIFVIAIVCLCIFTDIPANAYDTVKGWFGGDKTEVVEDDVTEIADVQDLDEVEAEEVDMGLFGGMDTENMTLTGNVGGSDIVGQVTIDSDGRVSGTWHYEKNGQRASAGDFDLAGYISPNGQLNLNETYELEQVGEISGTVVRDGNQLVMTNGTYSYNGKDRSISLTFSE